MQGQRALQPVSKEPESKPTEQTALENCLLSLLRGIQNNLVLPDTSGGQELRTQLAALEARFQATDNARELVDSAVEILGRYGTQAKEAMASQKSGLTSAASELSNAIQALPGMQGNAERWNRVEDQIKALSPADNLDVAKARLCADVAVARAEALEERQKIGTLFSGMLSKLETPAEQKAREAPQPESQGYKSDQLTGLPSRVKAEVELTRVHGQPVDCHLALFVVKRLALINAKFGYARGDEVLLKVVAHLAQLLPNFNNLFRWAPCAFLTIAPPNFTYKDLRSTVQAIELARLTPTLEWEGRSAMVPVVIDCRIVPVKDFGRPSELFLRLDTLATDS
jgi:GGDEF domain-containing protein